MEKKTNEKKTIERKTKKYHFITSKLVYLEAYKMAKRHKVWWSRITVTEFGDPINGNVNIEFRAKVTKEDIIDKDIAYLKRLSLKVSNIYNEGERAIYLKDKES